MAVKIEGDSDGRQDGETTHAHVVPEINEHRHRKSRVAGLFYLFGIYNSVAAPCWFS